jgi:hypothetical protein
MAYMRPILEKIMCHAEKVRRKADNVAGRKPISLFTKR